MACLRPRRWVRLNRRLGVLWGVVIGTGVRVYRQWMTEMMPLIDQSWVPEACTLPTVEQPLRAKEFDDLFRNATTAVDRIDTGWVRLVLRPEPGVAARAADLAVRETRCCSFFGFALSAGGGGLTLDITAPVGQVAVFDALVDRARFAAGLVSR
jgi:hypothetical protein